MALARVMGADRSESCPSRKSDVGQQLSLKGHCDPLVWTAATLRIAAAQGCPWKDKPGATKFSGLLRMGEQPVTALLKRNGLRDVRGASHSKSSRA